MIIRVLTIRQPWAWLIGRLIIPENFTFTHPKHLTGMRFSGWRKGHLRWMQDAKPWNISKSGLEGHQKTR